MSITATGSSQLAAQAQMQMQMHSANESQEAPGTRDHDGDSDKQGAQPAQAASTAGPRVNAAGQSIGQHINVTA
ncbi:hypothetical protein [Salinisphaera sp. LB1]|uniref:hypothetical protein n=1 Tax=Salinisphaera sp. LB1 TaxID=2183911 RepID=UPI000D706BFB|nr:hypothetical protein [Salinisphaera sp. LB1]AWN15523.1 hypothetical protein SALB1_1320 [Salinisphaera sp. LB1]